MNDIYRIPQCRREDIEKQLAKYQRKAEKYSKVLEYEMSEPYAISVPVYDTDGAIRYKIGTQMVEVFTLTIKGETIRKDGYTVIARIEHLEGGNVVNCFGEENKPEWSHMEPYCEHCRSHRRRNVTFIVNGKDEKQIGSTCLMDYCGIDPNSIGWRNDLREIMLNNDVEHYDFSGNPIGRVYDPTKVLAHAIAIEKKFGYIRSGDLGANKDKLIETVNGEPTEANMKAAQQMVEIIMAMTELDAREFLLDNTQSILRSEYCKKAHFGYLAYAPVAVRKYQDELEQKAAKEAEKDAQKASEYVGNIGDRRTFKIAKMELITSWETMYGYTYLYKFIDRNGNVLVWFASRTIKNTAEIVGTIKDHCERDGVRQTVITRCKVC